MNEEFLLALIFISVIAAGVSIVITGIRQRTRMLEMQHRERLAMIERGLMPSSGLTGSPYDRVAETQRANRSSRLLSGGIVIIGLGLAIAMLIGFASREGEIAVGVGGAIVVLGAAFVIIALTVHGRPKEDPYTSASRAMFNSVPPGHPPDVPRPPYPPSSV